MPKIKVTRKYVPILLGIVSKRRRTPRSEAPKWGKKDGKIEFKTGIDLYIFELTDFDFEGDVSI